jgi:MFS family permease
MEVGSSSNSHRTKIFYGWYIVAGLASVGAVSAGMGGVNFGLFIPPMSEELGIKHAIFGWTMTARLVGYSASSFIIGRILDKYGARFPMAIAGCFMGLAMVGLSLITSDWQLVAIMFFIGVIGMQGGGGNLYQSVPLSRWFIRLRGRAMAVTFVGIPVGIFIFSPLTQYLIDTMSWRAAWLILGGGGSLVIVLVGLLIVRKDPESMGLQPDGDLIEDDDTGDMSSEHPPVQAEYSWTRAQAIRSFAFWALIIVVSVNSLGWGALGMFRIPFYIERGVSPQLVAWALSAEAVMAAIIAFPTGWAMDRLQPRFVVAATQIVFIIVFIVTMNVTAAWHVFAATIIFGIMGASSAIAQNALWPAYFGGKHIGSIRGLSVPLILVFSGLGAPITGAIKDATGTYKPAWLVVMALLVGATILILMTPKPAPPEKQ